MTKILGPNRRSLSVSAFARRVRADEAAVRKAISTGRIERSLGRDARGRVVIADAALAVQEWRANRDPAKLRSARGTGPTTADVRRRLVAAQAEWKERQNSIAAGEVLEVSAVLAVWSELLGTVRARLLALPSSLAPVLAQESDQRRVFDELTRAVRDALAELSAWRPPGPPPTGAPS